MDNALNLASQQRDFQIEKEMESKDRFQIRAAWLAEDARFLGAICASNSGTVPAAWQTTGHQPFTADRAVS